LAATGLLSEQIGQDSLKHYRDLKNSLDTSFAEGKQEVKQEGWLEGKLESKLEGKLEEKTEVIKNGQQAGLSVALLAQLTSLTEAEVAQVLNNQKR
jgi:predicted transposase YdaD